MIGIMVSKIIANLAIVALVVLFLVLCSVGLEQINTWNGEFNFNWLPGLNPIQDIAWGIAGVTSLSYISFYIARRFGSSSGAARFFGWFTFGCFGLLILSSLLSVTPSVFEAYVYMGNWVTGLPILPDRDDVEFSLTLISGLLPLLSGIAALFFKDTRWFNRLMEAIFLFSGPVFFLLAYLFLCSNFSGLNGVEAGWSIGWLIAVMIGFAVWGFLIINANTNSLHPFYRDRLCECYLPSETKQTVKLSELGKSSGPYHLLNCAVNLPNSNDPNLRGRNADFFLFSERFCGSPLTGYIETKELEEKRDSHIDLGTAMAISGAAVNSVMGSITPTSFKFLITLFNLRLGYWLPNPRRDNHDWVSKHFLPNGWHLLCELFSRQIHENGRLVNLSDGGHIENLGVYELLRRRCRFVIAVIGSRDPKMRGGELRRLQRLASIDFGIEIDINLNDLSLNERGLSKAPAVLGKIHYPDNKLGWLLVIQQTMTGVEPAYVLDYQKDCPSFPHETTGDQFFSEEQFEAYRALGLSAAETLFKPPFFQSKEAGEKHVTINAWFKKLVAGLLPDNDSQALQPQKHSRNTDTKAKE